MRPSRNGPVFPLPAPCEHVGTGRSSRRCIGSASSRAVSGRRFGKRRAKRGRAATVRQRVSANSQPPPSGVDAGRPMLGRGETTGWRVGLSKFPNPSPSPDPFGADPVRPSPSPRAAPTAMPPAPVMPRRAHRHAELVEASRALYPGTTRSFDFAQDDGEAAAAASAVGRMARGANDPERASPARSRRRCGWRSCSGVRRGRLWCSRRRCTCGRAH